MGYNVEGKLFIHECLTKKNRELMHFATQLKKKRRLTSAFSIRGHVFVRAQPKTDAIKVTDVKSIESVAALSKYAKMSQHQLFSPTSPYKVTPMQEHNDENVLTPFRNWSQYNSGISGAPNQTAANLLTEVATLKRKMDEEGEKSEARHKELMEQNEIFYQQAKKQDLLIKRIAA
ncbi:uncharacterized protein LOC118749067, partial [Rhagoletis pomonella]|uniref:uncharacterized protein LOC118749067 n=1 Tax=Rhagoletis pomonella TaxID=28610 RepID=UPI001784CF33